MKIHISNEKLLNEKLNKFNSKNFHVVADFDGTLTKAFVKGQKTHTTIAQIREGNYLTKDYPKRAHELFDRYHPFETSNELTLKEKCDKMHEWWKKHLELMIECGMNKEVIEDIIKKKKIKIREGTFKFLDSLNKNNIPILILSAGLGDVIQEFLKAEGKLSENLHIISNFYEFNYKGIVTGYKSQIIHSFNKNEVAVKEHLYYNEIQNKKNVILLGDGIGDLGMSAGIKHEEIIRICFLNHDIENNLKEVSENFDVVILNDGTMEYVNKLIEKIL